MSIYLRVIKLVQICFFLMLLIPSPFPSYRKSPILITIDLPLLQHGSHVFESPKMKIVYNRQHFLADITHLIYFQL